MSRRDKTPYVKVLPCPGCDPATTAKTSWCLSCAPSPLDIPHKGEAK